MSAKPVVYFIDDSATMREVIKIAFRREDLDVITCHDASSAMDLMDHSAPNVVITDVIMPGRDGYEVCQYIKQHPRFSQTPVILMSGVVNKGVAERAFAVQANELIRKPFQPQDLIARVRHLLAGPVGGRTRKRKRPSRDDASAVLSSIFSGPMPSRSGHAATRIRGPVPVPPRVTPRPPSPSIAATVAAAMALPCSARRSPSPARRSPVRRSFRCRRRARTSASAAHARQQLGRGKMRLEILRLHSQIKKLEANWSPNANTPRPWSSTSPPCRNTNSRLFRQKSPDRSGLFLLPWHWLCGQDLFRAQLFHRIAQVRCAFELEALGGLAHILFHLCDKSVELLLRLELGSHRLPPELGVIGGDHVRQ